jgi:hypothetical protein
MIYNNIGWVYFTHSFFYINPKNFIIFALIALGANLDDESTSRTIYLSLLNEPRRLSISHRLPHSRSEASID